MDDRTAPEAPLPGPAAGLPDEGAPVTGVRVEPPPVDLPVEPTAVDAAAEPLAVGVPVEPPAGDAAVEPPVAEGKPEPPARAAGARRRSPFYLRGRRLRFPRSRRGLFALLLILSGLGGVAAFSAVSLIQWTETADFCGRCHSMAPELAAYEAGPHKEVSCAECHVEPGIAGWVKAKLNGTRQLIEMVLGTFPTPIPPPDHADLPDPSLTCAKCHDPLRRALTGLKTETVFTEDESNTRQFVGLMIRPAGGDAFDVSRSVHWHVLREVQYSTTDKDANSIDYIAATRPDGGVDEFISQDKVTVADDVGADIARIKAAEPMRVMTCYDCHNRAGHSIPSPRIGLDYALQSGTIDDTLPYIKREGMRLLWGSYPDFTAADSAIDRLRDFYQTNYPLVSATKSAEIGSAIDEVKTLYRLTATPEMKVTAKTYPDNLGHLDFPGCFRCHDGGHFLVQNGVVTNKTIPSTCNTCHTFPQLGPAVASLPLGEPPSTHTSDPLWVFNHRDVAKTLDPGGTTCGECHARDYCVNCHSTGAVTVDHDEMATNHAAVIRRQGNGACAYCHQPVYCARCHTDQVLPVTTPFVHGATGRLDVPEGVAWPLVPKT